MIKNDLENQKALRKQIIAPLQNAEKMEALLSTLQGYSRKLASGPNDKAGRGILRISFELSQKYAEKLLSDFESCFRRNVEYELWKGCFYSPIEVLRKRSEDGGPHAELFKGFLVELIENAITFYENLLNNYEANFCIDFSNFYQPYETLLSLEKWDECAVVNGDLPVVDSMVLRSAQRLIICFADLYRYKAQISHKDVRTYSFAKSLYWQAHLLEPLNGHPFNQLAVVACYEKKWVDVLFYYIRALSVLLPFKSARESLVLALDSLKQPALTYEKWIFELIEEESKNIRATTNNYESGPYSDILNKENKLSNNYREVWIHPSNESLVKVSHKNQQPVKLSIEDTLAQLFVGENGKNIQKKAICHLLHCAGVLISTIGLDQFKRSYELILNELLTLVHIDDTILSPAYLLKIIVLYTFPIHSPKPDVSQVLLENQRCSAFEMASSSLEHLLEILYKDMDKIGLFILTGQLSKKFSCILPSICFLAFWLYRTDKHLILNVLKRYRIFELFVLIGNRLYLLRQRRTLCALRAFSELEDPAKDLLRIILPEFVILTPYFDILSKSSVQFFIDVNSLDVEVGDKDKKWITVQARFAFILRLCEYLSEDEYFPIKFDVNNTTNDPFRVLPRHKAEESQKLVTDGMLHEKLAGTGEGCSNDMDVGNGRINPSDDFTLSTSTDEHELKTQLLSEEISLLHHRLVEVRPKYLVCDTNTLIDYPEEIKFFVSHKISILLVPTIVIDELSSLVKGMPINSPTLLPRKILNPEGSHSAFVMSNANKAIDWLREAAENKAGNVFTLTVNGNIIQRPSFVTECGEYNYVRRTNDDKILSACINLCRRFSKTTGVIRTSKEEAVLQRTVVLLTEDRGLSAKALASRVPVRTFPNFLKWAFPDAEKSTKNT